MGDITLRRAIEEYEDIYMASRNFAQKTRVEYLNDVEDLISFLEILGLKEAKDIELAQLERYLAELDRRRNAGSTRKRKVVSIRSFLWYLYQNQYIRINLARQLISPFAEVKTPRFLTKIEYERLLIICTNNLRDFALIQLLLQTGIKLSELIALTNQDVELPSVISPSGYLHIAGSRRRKGRRIPLNDKACKSLAEYLLTVRLTPSASLFNNRFDEPLRPRGAEKIVRKYMLRAGIRGASVQSLRHTFAVHSLMSSMDLKTIEDVMGLSPVTSITYLSVLKEAFGKDIQKSFITSL
jgi:integrase/recombinase XerD